MYAPEREVFDPSFNDNNKDMKEAIENDYFDSNFIKCGDVSYLQTFLDSKNQYMTRLIKYDYNPSITILQTSLIFEFKFADEFENKKIMVFSKGKLIGFIAPHSSADGHCNRCFDSVDEHNQTIQILNFDRQALDKIELVAENKTGLWAFSLRVEHVICPENSFYDGKDSEGFSCKCGIGFYRDHNSDFIRCFACAEYCKRCSGPNDGECFECVEGFIKEDSVCRNKTGK